MTQANQIVLAKRPTGDVTADCFREETVTLPALADGQLLVRGRFLSLDPYMRPRMTEMRSYTPPFELGQPLTGGSVGEVVESRNPEVRQGRHGDRHAELGDATRSMTARACARSRPTACRCRPISACSACRPSPPGTA